MSRIAGISRAGSQRKVLSRSSASDFHSRTGCAGISHPQGSGTYYTLCVPLTLVVIPLVASSHPDGIL